MNFHDLSIDKNWTLFLDRDGVINRQIVGDYVRSAKDLEFLPDSIKAISNLSTLFGRVIIVTNQQGVGKGLMTEGDLSKVHSSITQHVQKIGGHIDAIYHAPQLVSEKSEMRKPEIGMALMAKKDFPEIEFSKSIMVGDSLSDIQFGKNANMKTVLIKSKNQPNTFNKADFEFMTLYDFALELAL